MSSQFGAYYNLHALIIPLDNHLNSYIFIPIGETVLRSKNRKSKMVGTNRNGFFLYHSWCDIFMGLTICLYLVYFVGLKVLYDYEKNRRKKLEEIATRIL
jgi:hypothetical protein